MMRLIVLAASLICAATAASPQTPVFHHEPIVRPDERGAIILPSVPAGTADEEQWMRQNGDIGVRNVTRPILLPVLPKGPATGAAVIVAPGGGFLGLAIDTEGWQVAQWLADHGIAAFVLKYRVMRTPASNAVWDDEFNRMLRGEKVSFANPTDTPPEAIADGLSALDHVRANATRYHIDPKRIGFMGFSAGGFLTRSVIEKAGDAMPAFAAPIYPNMAAMNVPPNAPPMFVLIASDDFLLQRVNGLPLVHSYRATGKPIAFHLLANGGHGFGVGRPGTDSMGWLEQFYRWLDSIGMLRAARP